MQHATVSLISMFDNRFECSFSISWLVELCFLQKFVLVPSIMLNRREGCVKFPFSEYCLYHQAKRKVGRYFDKKLSFGKRGLLLWKEAGTWGRQVVNSWNTPMFLPIRAQGLDTSNITEWHTQSHGQLLQHAFSELYVMKNCKNFKKINLNIKSYWD